MPSHRDAEILRQILRYCEQTETAHTDFGYSRERFNESTTYQNAVCMCILQIGELVGRLSEPYRQAHPEVPWQRIRGMRNFVAHEYGHLDLDVVWYAADKSIPELKEYCRIALK